MKRAASSLFEEDGKCEVTSKPLKKQSEEDIAAGPSSLREAFQWPSSMVTAIIEDKSRMCCLKQSLSSTWTLTSNYSGLCTEETAVDALQGGLQVHAEKLGLDPNKSKCLLIDYVSACDMDGACQGLGLGVPASRDAKHYYNKMGDWLVQEVSDHLDAMEKSMPSLKAHHLSKQSRQEAVQKRIEGYEAMGEYLLKKSKTDNIVKSECFCVKHLQECSMTPSSSKNHESSSAGAAGTSDTSGTPSGVDENKCSIEVAGLTCVAFSPYGKHEGLAHESMRPFFTWCVLMRARQPLILIIESASAFPKQKLEMFLHDLYHLEFIDHPGPCLHGWPITRPRMYCLAFLRSKVTFLGSAAEYTALFKRTVQMDGNDLFFLPADHAGVLQEFHRLCARRGFNMSDEMCQQPWDKCYPANQQNLVQQHRSRANSGGQPGSTGQSQTAYITDLDHNVGFVQTGPWWPCLIRHGTIFSIQKGRHATVAELFGAQGFPTSNLLQAPYTPAFAATVQQSAAESNPKWTRAAWQKMIGNAMFVPTLGSMILYALSHIEWQPANLLNMRSRLSFSSVEDHSQREDMTDGMEADCSLGGLGL